MKKFYNIFDIFGNHIDLYLNTENLWTMVEQSTFEINWLYATK